ncbi:MAG: single-stranded DNA-binding protein [Ignavibacteriales bacterium]|jgi:single-strand DNA-binding protein|nr:single-stranded DNA-binding protein [Ignavibacteriales bacterium]MBK7266997.1 single-stranded DNA-binding protein [Ignavibacteriales bacterium]MBP7541995.1 single-stranded DNA-binding protein [Ignavibacteriaceae bacterium]MBP9122550.1 single-stranded DNA-binding protein [Ignavibacteriaceae bacterium]
MALSLNKVMLLGNLGRDAETRFSNDNSIAITTFSLATSLAKKGRDGNWTNETTWHNITAFNVHERTLEALKKGTRAYIEGRIQIRDYTKQDGTAGKAYDIVADKVTLVDKRADSEGGAFEAQHNEGQAPAPFEAPQSTDKKEDDLPF